VLRGQRKDVKEEQNLVRKKGKNRKKIKNQEKSMIERRT
jgi:hypothetical protein